MKEPTRWSDSASDVDPVVRSVLRYGRDMSPNAEQLQTVLRGVKAARLAAPRTPTPSRHGATGRRLGATGVALVASFVGAAAWASYVAVSASQVTTPAPTAESAMASVEKVAALGKTLRSRVHNDGTNAEVESKPAPTQTVGPLPSPARTATLPPRQASSEHELLSEARAALATDPGRTIRLVEEHTRTHPRSTLQEERRALRIEALVRLGQKTEAARRFAEFEGNFPQSPYRRRLARLVAADSLPD